MQIIPDEPKIPLENYLDLIEEKDGKGPDIYPKNAELVREVWSEIVKTRKRSLYVRVPIPQKLGISCMGFCAYKNGKKASSIQMLHKLLALWQELCNKSSYDMKKKWDTFFYSNLIFCAHSRHREIQLPRFLLPKSAYLIGWICGDGNFSVRNNYVLTISEKSRRQLVLNPLLNELFHVSAPIFEKSQNGHVLQISCKPVFKFLANVLNVEAGKIPLMIKNIDISVKRYFLAGLFDAEGYIAGSYRDSIVITQADYHFLENLIELFEDFDIYFSGPYVHQNRKGTWFTIQLRRKNEILKFAARIGSYHVDKSPKLGKLVMQIEKSWRD